MTETLETAPAARPQRPLSPHVMHYRWQVTALFSGMHRVTGMALIVGTLLLLWWLLALASGPEAYAYFQGWMGSFLGRTALLGWTFSLYYHLINGMRHLYWDTGQGLTNDWITVSAWWVASLSVVSTFGTWLIAYAVR